MKQKDFIPKSSLYVQNVFFEQQANDISQQFDSFITIRKVNKRQQKQKKQQQQNSSNDNKQLSKDNSNNIILEKNRIDSINNNISKNITNKSIQPLGNKYKTQTISVNIQFNHLQQQQQQQQQNKNNKIIKQQQQQLHQQVVLVSNNHQTIEQINNNVLSNDKQLIKNDNISQHKYQHKQQITQQEQKQSLRVNNKKVLQNKKKSQRLCIKFDDDDDSSDDNSNDDIDYNNNDDDNNNNQFKKNQQQNSFKQDDTKKRLIFNAKSLLSMMNNNSNRQQLKQEQKLQQQIQQQQQQQHQQQQQQQHQQQQQNQQKYQSKHIQQQNIIITKQQQHSNNKKKKNVLLVDFDQDSSNSQSQQHNNNNNSQSQNNYNQHQQQQQQRKLCKNYQNKFIVDDKNVNIENYYTIKNIKQTTQTTNKNKPNIFLSNFQDSDYDDIDQDNYFNSNQQQQHKQQHHSINNFTSRVNLYPKKSSSSSSQTSSPSSQSHIIKPICISQFSNIISTNDMSLAYQSIPQHCVLQTIVKRYSAQQMERNGNVGYELFDSATYKSLLKVKKVSQGFQMLWSLQSSRNKWHNNNKNLMSTTANKKTKQDISCALITSNFFGTQFNCYKFNRNNQKPQEKKLNRLITIDYEANFLGLKGPRKMQVYIPCVDSIVRGEKGLNQLYQQQQKLSKQLTNNLTTKKVQKFINRTPKWNNQISSFVLNFHGRATVSSVKNFIITNYQQNEQKKHTKTIQKDLVLFGKIDKNIFNLDIKYPFNIVQGLALALSSFDKKIGCE